MIHLPDDMLLAYVRQQQRNLWTSQMQEHLNLCPVCRRRCAEFKTTGDILEAWTHSSAADPRYATVSNGVIRTLYEPKATPIERMRSTISRVRVVLPVVVVVVLLFAVLLVGLRVNTSGKTAKTPNRILQTPHIVQQPTPKPSGATPTLGPIGPTATSVPSGPVTTATVVPGGSDPMATSTPQSEPSIEVNSPCTTVIDVAKDQLHVCGAHFTPDTIVTISYHIGTTSDKHIARVGADGTFNDILYIQSCNGVPGSVYVQSSANPPETAQITKNITFGTCQGFEYFRKTK